MGVPGFFLWLMKNYKKDGFVFQKEKLNIVNIQEFINNSKNKPDDNKILSIEYKNKFNENLLQEINTIDWFLIDANCLIHPVCFKTIAENPDLNDRVKLEGKMMNAVIDYLEKIISYVNPLKGVYLAIDGVAPVAKIKQQRTRRFKSVADKIMWDKIKKKHNKPISNNWNNNAITPGTVFMEKLHHKILEWGNNQTRKIIYSSCFTPAEGEHKLLQFIRNNQMDSNSNDMSYCIYGLDADLIFLALSTQSEKIYLLREANEINKNESKEVLNFVSIRLMKESIVSTIKHYLIESSVGLLNLDKLDNTNNLFGFENNNSEQNQTIPINSILSDLNNKNVVNDFIFMCYFLGNDFLPHIPSLDIHHDGVENLIIEYVETINEYILENNKISYLIDKKFRINEDFLQRFINKLAQKEEGILRENFAKGRKRMNCDGDEYEKEVFRIDNLQFKIYDPIQLGTGPSDEWRLRYYQHYWNINPEELEEFSEKLVQHYIIGIKWVTLYYFDKCPSWDWYYPFDHPPFISDIAKYINKIKVNKIRFQLGRPLKPFMQLLSVLPPQSCYLLPNSLTKLVTHPKSSLAFMYPQEFEQDFVNKRKHWSAIPKLPPLDIDLIKKSYFKYQDELKNNEISRNQLMNIFEIGIGEHSSSDSKIKMI